MFILKMNSRSTTCLLAFLILAIVSLCWYLRTYEPSLLQRSLQSGNAKRIASTLEPSLRVCKCHVVDGIVVRHTNTSKGRGIFATRDLPKGTTWYQLDCGHDANKDWGDCLLLSKQTILAMMAVPALQDFAKYIWEYSWFAQENRGFVVDFDIARYTNHCLEPNSEIPRKPDVIRDRSYTLRDIKAGEEICEDYNTYHMDELISRDTTLLRFSLSLRQHYIN